MHDRRDGAGRMQEFATLPGRIALSHDRAAIRAVFLANGLGIGAWAAALPGLQRGLSFSTAQLSLALLAFAVGAVIAMTLAGATAVKISAARLTRLSAISFAIALVCPAFSPNLPLLICSAGLLGAANGTLDVAMNGHAVSVEQQWGAPIMSSFHAAFSIGGLIGAALSGVVGEMAGVEAGLLSVAGLIFVLIAVASPALVSRGSSAAGPRPVFSWPTPRTLGLCAVAFICLLTEGAMVDWSAIYLATTTSASSAMSAAGYAAFSIAMASGRLIGDRVVAAVGGPRVMQVGAALAALGLGLAALVPVTSIAVVGFALVGFGLANIVPTLFSIAGRIGTSAASGIAIVATAGYAGFVAGPPAIGVLASLASLQFAMACLAAGAIAMAFVCRFGKEA
jgi:MFS family permease